MHAKAVMISLKAVTGPAERSPGPGPASGFAASGAGGGALFTMLAHDPLPPDGAANNKQCREQQQYVQVGNLVLHYAALATHLVPLRHQLACSARAIVVSVVT